MPRGRKIVPSGAEEAAKKLDFRASNIPQGLKPSLFLEAFTARLKSCPDAFGCPNGCPIRRL